jgi:hypothetical protein
VTDNKDIRCCLLCLEFESEMRFNTRQHKKISSVEAGIVQDGPTFGSWNLGEMHSEPESLSQQPNAAKSKTVAMPMPFIAAFSFSQNDPACG